MYRQINTSGSPGKNGSVQLRFRALFTNNPDMESLFCFACTHHAMSDMRLRIMLSKGHDPV